MRYHILDNMINQPWTQTHQPLCRPKIHKPIVDIYNLLTPSKHQIREAVRALHTPYWGGEDGS